MSTNVYNEDKRKPSTFIRVENLVVDEDIEITGNLIAQTLSTDELYIPSNKLLAPLARFDHRSLACELQGNILNNPISFQGYFHLVENVVTFTFPEILIPVGNKVNPVPGSPRLSIQVLNPSDPNISQYDPATGSSNNPVYYLKKSDATDDLTISRINISGGSLNFQLYDGFNIDVNLGTSNGSAILGKSINYRTN